MKKVISIIIITFIILSILEGKTETLIIPNEAIRFRVIANSNSKNDQELKLEVRDALQKEAFRLMSTTETKEEASQLLKTTIPEFDNLVKTITKSSNQSYKINYGMNYFPPKTYKGVEYKEGNYESLVVTLGEGKGDNWWCVLFPPLCLLETEETEETTNVEYKFFVQELIEKFFPSN